MSHCRRRPTAISMFFYRGLSVLLLFSCGSGRHTFNPRAEELTHFVLIIEEANGQAGYSWQRATDFDLPHHDVCESDDKTAMSITLAAVRPRNCDQEQIDCYRQCMKNKLPSSLGHIKRDDGGKSRYCSTMCLDEYMECLKLRDLNALEFSSPSEATDWLKKNQTRILVGSIVIIAGVAFVTISAGAGLVVLAPIILVAG